MINLNYEKFNPPFWWENFQCTVLDSWYDDDGTRHHTCVGDTVEEGVIWNNAIIHKGENNV